jgi:hypothetical protein
MTELRAGATVRGTDGWLGQVDALVVDPVRLRTTHLVVRHDAFDGRRLVTVDHVEQATRDEVVLDLDTAGLRAAAPFDEPHYNLPGSTPEDGGLPTAPRALFYEPYASPVGGWIANDVERIPAGEVTIRRHDTVHTADGTHVGHVDELVVDADGAVTHLVLREDHLLRRDQDVVVPVGGATFSEGSVVLGLDLAAVEALPHHPVRRHGHLRGPDLTGG